MPPGGEPEGGPVVAFLIVRRILRRIATSNVWVLLAVTAVLFIAGFVTVYFTERGNAEFRGWGDCVWWAIVTMSTVGYGDKVPTTAAGRAIASICMVGGPILLVSSVGSMGALVFDEWRRLVTGMAQAVFKGHIVICGWSAKARDAISELRMSEKFRRRPIIIIDDRISEKPVDDANVVFIQGSPADTSVLERANIRQASFAIAFAEDNTPAADQKTALTILAIKTLNPSIRSCAELNDANNEAHLRRAGCNVVVDATYLTSRLLALSLENPAVNRVIRQLVSFSEGNEVYRLECPMGYVGRPFEEPFVALKSSQDMILIGVERGDTLILNPSPSFELQEGDFLLVISEEPPEIECA